MVAKVRVTVHETMGRKNNGRLNFFSVYFVWNNEEIHFSFKKYWKIAGTSFKVAWQERGAWYFSGGWGGGVDHQFTLWLVSFDWSNNTGAIGVKMDASILEEKSSFLFLNCESLHAKLNNHYEAWSYKKKKHKKIIAYGKSV